MNTNLILAEDDDDDIEFFIDVIAEISADIKITITKNGIELMTLLEIEKELPDFIFLDLNMPKKSGFECLKEIRSSEKWKAIKVVILSTTSDQEQIKEVYKMGADLYLQKTTSYSAYKNNLSMALQMDWDTLKF